MKQPTVCISPLDWGLGHATRCIPLIRAFQALNYKVYIATKGRQEEILKEAIPDANFLPLDGYKIWYTRKSHFLILGIILQLPKILIAICKEYFWLKRTAKQYAFDLIISDNRFGFFHKKIKSVFITHQLALQTPVAWGTSLYQNISYPIIQQFSACWIADNPAPFNVAGVLSNPTRLPKLPVTYLNSLSHLPFAQLHHHLDQTKKENLYFLGIVSGPEPQRTLFENILWEQGNKIQMCFSIAAGLPGNGNHTKQSENGKLYHHLNETDLMQKIVQADYIICRGGYTTLMELIPFQKKIILVPTPGQTEQGYLGKYWEFKKWALCFEQSNFNLEKAIEKAKTFEYQTPPNFAFNTGVLVNALKQLSL